MPDFNFHAKLSTNFQSISDSPGETLKKKIIFFLSNFPHVLNIFQIAIFKTSLIFLFSFLTYFGEHPRAIICLSVTTSCTRANETRPMRVDMILTASLTQRRLATWDIHGLRNDSQSREPGFSGRSIGLPGEIAATERHWHKSRIWSLFMRKALGASSTWST